MATGFSSPIASSRTPIISQGGVSEQQVRQIIRQESPDNPEGEGAKVFLEQPTPPYKIGDMWITSSGEIFLCEVEKESGIFELGDFVKKLSYTDNTVANEKRRVFVDQPIPPYDVGDLWLYDGDMYRCFSERQTGSFSQSDWGAAVDYTNDDYAKDVEVIMQENLSVLYKSDEKISQKVQSTIVTLNNDYLTAEQIETINEENAASFAILEQYMTEQTQLNNRFEFSITNIIDNGVSKVQNTLVTIDQDGVHVAKLGDQYSSLLSNEGVYYYSFGEEISWFTATETYAGGNVGVGNRLTVGGLILEYNTGEKTINGYIT